MLYGCGDFLNDYEGIRGYEHYRDDLTLMYFADVNTMTRDLMALKIVPLQIRGFRLIRPSRRDVDWLRQTLDTQSRTFGAHILATSEEGFALSWRQETGGPNHRRSISNSSQE